MPVPIAKRADITIDAVRRVAWDGEDVELAPEALARMDRCHASFTEFVEARVAEDPGALIYGTTTAPGDGAAVALTPEAQARRPTRLWTAHSFGDPLPERVVRAIVLARLANFVEGHAAVRSSVARAVAALLREPLPTVPAEGNGGAGEIIALGRLFYELSERTELEPKERMALINGSPCAAALVADAALAGRTRLALAEAVFALAVEAARAPLEAYSEDLEALWDDEHEAAALRALRALVAGGAQDRQTHQGAVSFRILPRVLGQARRAQAEGEAAAAVALRSVTDNPVYIAPDADRPLGAVLSNGGYHNARASAAVDGLGIAWADLCQIAQRLTDKLLQLPSTAKSLARDEWTMKPMHMVQTGWAEEARAHAGATLLSLGGFGQNDVPSMSFLAWRRADAAGRCLDAMLAVLAAFGAQVLHGDRRPAPPALAALVDEVREVFPPVDGVRALGPDAAALAAAFDRRVFAGRVASAPRG
ncbi:MAG TPA: aromatic amino acid lyase [Solirubrobacteraceae bacterium]|nr:aromatic amino acid lyase [Solirubrobacteraceae bacterium]